VTEPTNPTPQQKAQSLKQTFERWDSGQSTIEITKPPSKAVPIPEDPSPFDDEDESA
jgi:hypothetical protein